MSALGRTKVPHEYVEQIEQAVRNKMDEGTKELNQAIDGAELLFKNHSIETVATYDTVPLEVEVGITSALGRRYFELIHKLDQIMALLQTLEIEEVVNEQPGERQRSNFKRIVLAMSSTARNFSMGVRRRMNEADAKKGEADDRRGRVNSEKAPVDGADVVATGDGEARPEGPAGGSGYLGCGNSQCVTGRGRGGCLFSPQAQGNWAANASLPPSSLEPDVRGRGSR